MTPKPKKTEAKKCRGRPCSFDRKELVEAVMHLFWERGYRNLSFNEIATATGLTRASLYNSFESKEALFLEALEHYFSQSPDAILDDIKPNDRVGPVLYEMFNRASKIQATDKKHRGCLAINCFSELITGDSEIGRKLTSIIGSKHERICHLMQQAIKQKELPPDTNVATATNLMMAFMSGFSIFSKGGADEKTLRTMCHTFLKQLGFDLRT